MIEAAFIAAQRRALAVVAQAVKRGDMLSPKKLKCVDCGKKAFQYDHRDYNKPLDVEPVCYGCNHKRGRAKFIIPKGYKYPDAVYIYILIPKKVKSRLRELARSERRTMSSMTAILLESALSNGKKK